MRKQWACSHKKPFKKVSNRIFRCPDCTLTVEIPTEKITVDKTVKERFNKEIIILETVEGTAHSKDQVIEAWNYRIKEYFPHYKILDAIFFKDEGKERP